MPTLDFTLLIFIGSLLAGFLGALTGLGGGVVIVPLLTLVFKVDIHYAIGATLVSVIATSSGAAAAYLRVRDTHMEAGHSQVRPARIGNKRVIFHSAFNQVLSHSRRHVGDRGIR